MSDLKITKVKYLEVEYDDLEDLVKRVYGDEEYSFWCC